MPRIRAHEITLHYEEQGSGEPLLLIPYLAADHACYAFQVPQYADHFRCISLDLRGTGESDKPDAAYSTEALADDLAAFMQAMGIERAHVSGVSLGGAVALWLAAKHPERVASLSVHSSWTRTDSFLATIVESWQVLAHALGVTEMIVRGIFPWCFTPEFYAAKPEFIDTLAAFVRSRPPQSVPDFVRQSNAVRGHDVLAQLYRITAPTQITFGRHDQLCSTRFAEALKAIPKSELVVFESASHAPLYERTEEFNQTTLSFLRRCVAATV
jgi:pimeloyl-ACP methyl ester carboxylesterase